MFYLPFEHCGFASLEDLKSKEWQNLFNECEEFQKEFLNFEEKFRSPEYKWPRDPLHTWSRVWEYPYVLYNIRKWRQQNSNYLKPIVVDFGSGVTFFPFMIAREGFKAICLDIDPICGNNIEKALKFISVAPGSLEFRLCSENQIPLEDNSCDLIYSISVLEHISDMELTIKEIARSLKPHGIFILTFDISLNNAHELSSKNYYILLSTLENYFEYATPIRWVHPIDYLTTYNGPFPMYKKDKLFKRMLKGIKHVIKPFLGRKNFPPFYLTCQGMVMRKM